MNIFGGDNRGKNFKNKGLYVTLAICVGCIFAAGWGIYQNMGNLPEENNSEKQDKQYTKKKINNAEQNKKSQENPRIEDFNEENQIADNMSSQEKYSQNSSDYGSYDYGYSEETQDDENLRSVSSDASQNLIIYPTNNIVIKEFSDGKPVYSKTLGDWRIHDGIDFKAEKGSTVKSITDGIVKDIYNDASYGMTVVIQHDPGFVAYYSGLGDTTLVKKDEKVKTGDEIGSINDVPIEISEEPHLHFMINQDGKFIDPILILEKDSD